MLKLMLLFATAAGTVVSSTNVVSDIIYDTTWGCNPLPVWDRGHLIFIINPPSQRIAVYAPYGNWAYDAYVRAPGGGVASVASTAADWDGASAAVFGYKTPNGLAGGIALFDADGNQTESFTTGRYMPSAVCFGDDYSIWTIGWQRDRENNESADRQDYPIFRHYSRQGAQLNAFVFRSVFTKGAEPGMAAFGAWRIRAIRDRVGAWVISGDLNTREWVELDLSGNVLGRWPLNPNQTGIAFTSNGDLYQTTSTEKGRTSEILVLDRASGSWQTVGDASSGILLGADGEELIVGVQERSAVHLRRIRMEKE